tara:strand:- start:133 stop:1218 length:1086 start_codon:yes stop_codon:yes gene_type:complete
MKGHIMDGLNGRRGFTLIEVGVLIAVAGSMGAVVIPGADRLQKASLDTKSQWVHHDLARRQFVYMGDHQGAFTGPNTSGADWNRDLISAFSNHGIDTLDFDTAGGNPTSQGDWITPLVGDAYGFSANRAVRTQQKFEVVADPTTDRMVDILFLSPAPADAAQFQELLQESGFRQRSFLQIQSFSHYSIEHEQRNVVIDSKNDIGYSEWFAVQSKSDLALTPVGYSPNVHNVGMQPSNKVLFSDGTRFYTDSLGLNIDIGTVAILNSRDSDIGPMLHGSAAYGRETSVSPSQMNLDLSYRKNGGEGMYVTMFDGSLQYMTREQSWTDPTPWYPSGSVWQSSENATPESQAWVKKNLPDGIIH